MRVRSRRPIPDQDIQPRKWRSGPLCPFAHINSCDLRHLVDKMSNRLGARSGVAVTLVNSGVSLPYASGPLTTAGLQPAPPAAGSERASRPARRAQPASQRWQGVLLWLLLAVVLLAPLPLGSNRPLPASALSAAIGVLLCVWGVVCLVARQPCDRADETSLAGFRPVRPRRGMGRGAGAAVHAGLAAPRVLERSTGRPRAALRRRDQRQSGGDVEPPHGAARLRRHLLARVPAVPPERASAPGPVRVSRQAGSSTPPTGSTTSSRPAAASSRAPSSTAIPTRLTRA